MLQVCLVPAVGNLSCSFRGGVAPQGPSEPFTEKLASVEFGVHFQVRLLESCQVTPGS